MWPCSVRMMSQNPAHASDPEVIVSRVAGDRFASTVPRFMPGTACASAVSRFAVVVGAANSSCSSTGLCVRCDSFTRPVVVIARPVGAASTLPLAKLREPIETPFT